MEETSRGKGYLEVNYLRGQGPIWAVAPLKDNITLTCTVSGKNESGVYQKIAIY
jgi:hypothetical protein